jgi:hypothetical protein
MIISSASSSQTPEIGSGRSGRNISRRRNRTSRPDEVCAPRVPGPDLNQKCPICAYFRLCRRPRITLEVFADAEAPKIAHRQKVLEFASVDVQTTCISKMRSKQIRIKTCRILPLFTHFPACIVAHFNLLDHLEPSARHDENGVAIRCFSTDTIQFEEVTASQSDRHKCTMSKPASRLSTSMRGSHVPSWRKGVNHNEIAER